ELALQLLVARVAAAVELAAGEGPPDRAARLAAMRAVGEAALRGERLDVRERLAEPLRRLPELELSHPRRVEDEAAAREEDELAVTRRVPAAPVGADLRRREQLLAGEPVHE